MICILLIYIYFVFRFIILENKGIYNNLLTKLREYFFSVLFYSLFLFKQKYYIQVNKYLVVESYLCFS